MLASHIDTRPEVEAQEILRVHVKVCVLEKCGVRCGGVRYVCVCALGRQGDKSAENVGYAFFGT